MRLAKSVEAKARAASWINTYFVSLETAANPARTDSDRVCPPTTTITASPRRL